jgi:hypothetical protein
MTITIRVTIDGHENVEEVARFERDELQAGNLGLSLAEAKSLLATVQRTMVAQQISAWVQKRAHCEPCGKALRQKGHNRIVLRTVFGKLNVDSPRLYYCSCQGRARASFSPLAELLPERTAPELRYLQTKWASLMSYGMTVDLLKDVLPVSDELSARAIRTDVERAAQRLESELGDERDTFIEGTPADWQDLPDPAGPLVVGIDGGYVHARSRQRREGWFEVIVGKSIPADGDPKCFGFVSRLDAKPKRRLYDMLASQGLQMNQQLVFLSDGGDTVRDLQMRMSPQAEHVLDWFHVTMRLTLMRQLALGLTNAARSADSDLESDTDDATAIASELIPNLTSLKWNLWHGNVRRALERVDDLACGVASLSNESENRPKLLRMLREFSGYIDANRAFIPNYGDRWRNGETISTAFVESAVNQIISRRFVKKQQMRWTERGSHHLLQIRTRVLNEEWRTTMARWNPGMGAAA